MEGSQGALGDVYCQGCAIVAAMAACCSLTCSNPTTQGFSRRLGKASRCFNFSESIATASQAFWVLEVLSLPFWVLEVPSSETVYAKDTQGF